MDRLGNGGLSHAGLTADQDGGIRIVDVADQIPDLPHGVTLDHQLRRIAACPHIGQLLGIAQKGILHLLIVAMDGIDLRHGDRIEAGHILQPLKIVKQGNSHRHHIGVYLVDGLCAGDAALFPNDLHRN